MHDLAHKETDVFKQMIESRKYTCFKGGLQTTGCLSLLTPWNPPPCLKFVFCAFKRTRDLVRSYVTLAINLICNLLHCIAITLLHRINGSSGFVHHLDSKVLEDKNGIWETGSVSVLR
jgi:hypothetical protein